MTSIRFLCLLFLLSIGMQAAASRPTDRRAILDAVRPAAAGQAGQAVRIRVDRINEDAGWAVVVGALVDPAGKTLDWSRAAGCEADLDKMLWAVLRRAGPAWKVEHLDICAPEPPYWSLEQYGGLVWPCGVYAGLVSSAGADLRAQCGARRASAPGQPPRR